MDYNNGFSISSFFLSLVSFLASFHLIKDLIPRNAEVEEDSMGRRVHL